MNVKELLESGRRKLFLAINPATNELVCFCPWSFPPLNPNPNSEGMLAEFPDLMDWPVLELVKGFGYTASIFHKTPTGDWVSESGEEKTAAEMDHLVKNTYVRFVPSPTK